MIFFILFNLIYFFGLLGGRIISINTVHHSFKKKKYFAFIVKKKNRASFCSLFVYFLCFIYLLFLHAVFLCHYCCHTPNYTLIVFLTCLGHNKS